jgi:SAM-dependent methyltransferase
VEMGRVHLLEQNVIHEFDAALVRRNLRGCYGQTATRFYCTMFPHILGTRVLDVGCGFGLFSHLCKQRGFHVHSIDIDEQSLEIARSEFQLDCRLESVYETSLAGDSIDTVAFNDVICHLEFSRLMPEIHRLRANRLILFDSNIANPLLNGYRRWSGHEEFRDYTLREIVDNVEHMGFRKVHSAYHNYLCLPISGGLQRNPLPLAHRFPGSIFFFDRVLQAIVPWMGLSRFLAFRYLAIFDKDDAAK